MHTFCPQQLKAVAAPSAALGLSWEVYLPKSTAAVMTASSAGRCQSEWPMPSITIAVATAVAVGTSSAVTRAVFVGKVWE